MHVPQSGDDRLARGVDDHCSTRDRDGAFGSDRSDVIAIDHDRHRWGRRRGRRIEHLSVSNDDRARRFARQALRELG